MDLQSTAGMSEKRTPFHREGDRAPDAGRPEFCSEPLFNCLFIVFNSRYQKGHKQALSLRP